MRDRALMKRPIDLVMFDLDGTLADTGQDLADAVNHTRAHFHLAPLPEALVHTHVGRGVEVVDGGDPKFPVVEINRHAPRDRHRLHATRLPQIAWRDIFQERPICLTAVCKHDETCASASWRCWRKPPRR